MSPLAPDGGNLAAGEDVGALGRRGTAVATQLRVGGRHYGVIRAPLALDDVLGVGRGEPLIAVFLVRGGDDEVGWWWSEAYPG